MFWSKTNIGNNASVGFYQLLIFLAAFLLFSLEPLISKYILPWFGGSPSVWTTALLFFQALLLAAYAFSHWLSRRDLTRQKIIYSIVLAAALLPWFWSWPQAQQVQATANPVPQILLLLLVSIGGPYFVLASASPLLQIWFSRAAGDVSPYRLYVWSNAGSLLGLLAYPTLIEPLWSLNTQKIWWYVFFVLTAAGLTYLLWHSRRFQNLSDRESPSDAPAFLDINWKIRLAWLIWPLIASFLLLAVTHHISQDIAAVPLLWVLPLALYLLSFIFTFAGERFYHRRFWSGLFLLSAWSAALVLSQADSSSIILILLSMLLFLLAACVVCHGELYRLRPAASRLTEFYLWLSAGGALGSFIVLIIAPLVFDFYAELPLGLALILLLTFFIWRKQGVWLWPQRRLLSHLCLSLTLVISLSVLAFNFYQKFSGPTLYYRDFFGVLNIENHTTYKSMGNGTTLHGLQLNDPDKKCQPVSYYPYDSGLGLAAAAKSEGADLKLGVVGLGTGTASVYGREVKFYELHPRVETLARQEFSFLSDCSPDKDIEVVLGDARLSLAREEDQNFDILAIDAFTSDAIPVHLLTQEAFEIYLRHLQEDGILAVHISNRYVNFRPVIGGLAEHFSLQLAIVKTTGDAAQGTSSSMWALLSRDQSFFDRLLAEGKIKAEDMIFSRQVLWTDKYSNIFTLLKWR